jgi:hypothetical protein
MTITYRPMVVGVVCFVDSWLFPWHNIILFTAHLHHLINYCSIPGNLSYLVNVLLPLTLTFSLQLYQLGHVQLSRYRYVYHTCIHMARQQVIPAAAYLIITATFFLQHASQLTLTLTCRPVRPRVFDLNQIINCCNLT